MEDWNRALLNGAILIASITSIANFITHFEDLASWIWPFLSAFYMWQYKRVYYENE